MAKNKEFFTSSPGPSMAKSKEFFNSSLGLSMAKNKDHSIFCLGRYRAKSSSQSLVLDKKNLFCSVLRGLSRRQSTEMEQRMVCLLLSYYVHCGQATPRADTSSKTGVLKSWHVWLQPTYIIDKYWKCPGLQNACTGVWLQPLSMTVISTGSVQDYRVHALAYGCSHSVIVISVQDHRVHALAYGSIGLQPCPSALQSQ